MKVPRQKHPPCPNRAQNERCQNPRIYATLWVREFHIHANLTKCVEPCGFFKPLICTHLLDLTLAEDSTTKAHDGTKLQAKHSKDT